VNVRHAGRAPWQGARSRSIETPSRRTVEGRITGIGKTIRITAIHVHYDLTVPAEAREATERALEAHPQGCPAHQSVKDAITISWSATVQAGRAGVDTPRSWAPCDRRRRGPKEDTMGRTGTR